MKVSTAQTMAGSGFGTSVAEPPASSAARRTAFAVLLSISLLSLLASSVLAYRYWSYRQTVTESSRTHLLSVTSNAAGAIDAIVLETVGAANAIAADLSSGALARDALLPRMKQTTEAHEHFYGVCVSYRPFAFDPKRRLYSAYFMKTSGQTQFVQLDTVYDYTLPAHEWFTPVIEEGPRWTQPYYDEAGVTSMITYSTPFYGIDPRTKARTPLGTVSIDISMDEMRRIIESLDLGPSGFGGLVSQAGLYLYHPNPEFVQSRKTLADVAREQNDRDRLVLADKVSKRESGILDHRSTTTGLAAWLIYAPVASTGWSLQNTFIVGDLPLDIDRLRREQIALAIALLAFACSAVSLVAGAHRGGTPNLWVTSSIVAVLIAVAIAWVWNLSLTYTSRNGSTGVAISDKATLATLMNAYTRTSADKHTEPPVYVPTGVFLESAYFSEPNNLSVTGYIWQKYTVGAHDSLTRGFTIAEATDVQVAENYRTVDKGVEIVRWYFHCIVRQRLDHRRYPLEQETIALRLLHKDLDHNVVLVPDLAAYRFVNPSARLGLEKELVFPGWKVTRTFFEFRNKAYDSNFGIERSLAKESFPALYYDILIERNFVDAFISNLTALIIVSVLLFTLLMIAVKDERLVGFMQVGSGRILSICAAMFFVIAFSHIDIRRKIAAEEVFYLEYFYLLIYVAILWISVNSVLFAMDARIWLIQYKENLISKLLFWPFLLMLLFATTVFTFY